MREHITQRTDSTHVLAAVRDLIRLELVTGTADRLPDLPGSERHPPAEVLTNPR